MLTRNNRSHIYARPVFSRLGENLAHSDKYQDLRPVPPIPWVLITLASRRSLSYLAPLSALGVKTKAMRLAARPNRAQSRPTPEAYSWNVLTYTPCKFKLTVATTMTMKVLMRGMLFEVSVDSSTAALVSAGML